MEAVERTKLGIEHTQLETIRFYELLFLPTFHGILPSDIPPLRPRPDDATRDRCSQLRPTRRPPQRQSSPNAPGLYGSLPSNFKHPLRISRRRRCRVMACRRASSVAGDRRRAEGRKAGETWRVGGSVWREEERKCGKRVRQGERELAGGRFGRSRKAGRGRVGSSSRR